MTDLNIMVHEEARLLDWGESRTAGPWIKIAFADPSVLDAFRGLDTKELKRSGHILHVTIAQGDIAALAVDASQPAEAQYGDHAKALFTSKILATDAFMQVIGTEKQYDAWVRNQPSCASGKFSMYVDGVGRCVAHHVRRASNSGTGIKGAYITIPLTDAEHSELHDRGEKTFVKEHGIHELDEVLWRHRHKWAWESLKSELGYSHWNEIPPETLRAWADIFSLTHLLPAIYREGRA